MNPEALMQMERLYLLAAQRVQACGYPPPADLSDLDSMGAFLRAEKRDWLTRCELPSNQPRLLS